jgi:hypothetical protein
MELCMERKKAAKKAAATEPGSEKSSYNHENYHECELAKEELKELLKVE